jgi:hypothetical protein
MAESNASKFSSKITSDGKIGQGGLAAGVGGTDWQSVITGAGGSSTAVAGKGYYIDTTSGTHTINLPASASFGDTIEFVDYAGTASTNTITIGRNGHKINNATADQTISKNFSGIKLVYVNTTVGWRSVSTSNVSDVARVTYSIDYLIVAGGGGGGGGIGGGGGAGGMKTGSVTLNPTTSYTATVGAGGTKSTGTVPGYGTLSIGTNGGDSSLAGSDITTVTSTGGGLGGSYHSTSVDQGADGGSGGGGAGLTDGSPVPGGLGTAGQGNDGGGGYGASSQHAPGGGGGAGEVGETGVSPGTNAGAGGDGLQSDITGSNTYYAGGGGGGCHESVTVTGGLGGQGGGGNGGLDGSPVRQAAAGGTNLGGGGGGGRYATNNDGANGGSGVVILKILTADYTGVNTGSPTVTTSGLYTIVKFTGTGTYTA